MEVTIQSKLTSTKGLVLVPTDPSQPVDSLIAAFCIEKGIQHRKEYVLRNKEHAVLENVKLLSTCGVVNGDILYLGIRDDEDQWMFGCNQWWLLACVALLVGGAGIVAISILKSQGDRQPDSYGIVIDAGSSHTQLYVYKWPGDKDNGTAEVKQIVGCKTKGGGISNYTDQPSAAGQSLVECLDQAKDNVPGNYHKKTPIFLGATAGMRLLRESDNATCQSIMSEVRSTISSYPFNFTDRQAVIIAGKDEGAFSWLTANYLTDSFGKPTLTNHLWNAVVGGGADVRTFGALDLGGASTQITFTPEDPDAVSEDYKDTLVMYSQDYDVYTESYLCYGINEAFRQYQAYIARESNSTVLDPCRPKGKVATSTRSLIFEAPCTVSMVDNTTVKYKSYTFEGQSENKLCQEAVVQGVFNFSSDTCVGNFCGTNQSLAHQPPLYGNFLAFSAYYYLMDFLNLTKVSNFTLVDFEQRRDALCKMDWDELKQVPSTTFEKDSLDMMCFEAHYVHTLLIDAYGFNDSNWQTLNFQSQINGADLGWSVGFMLNVSSVIPAVYPTKPLSLVAFILLIILFVVFLLVAIAFACHARKGKAKLPYQKLSTYGSV